MRTLYWLSVCLVLVCSQSSAQQRNLISGTFRGMSFGQVIENIEQQTSYRFFYDNRQTDTLRVDIEVVQQPIQAVLDQIFANTLFQFTVVGTKVFITHDRPIMTALPPGFFGGGNDRQRPVDFDYSAYERK